MGRLPFPMAKTELVPGTLTLLILRVLQTGPLHGYAIALRIGQLSAMCCKWKRGRSIRRYRRCS